MTLDPRLDDGGRGANGKFRRGIHLLWDGMRSLMDGINIADMALETLIFALIVIVGAGIGIYRCVSNVLP